MNEVEVNIDSSKVLNLFAELTGKQQKKVYRQALKIGANVLVKETRILLKTRLRSGAMTEKNRWNGKTLQSGIRSKINQEGTEAKINIMGDFRLKFFEMGTKPRFLKKQPRKGANRGTISPTNFFANAQRNTERPIFDNMSKLIEDSILKISRKK